MGRNKSSKKAQGTSRKINPDSGMAKRKTFLIKWSESSGLYWGSGHGVEFHSESPEQQLQQHLTPTPFAFLEGYEWFHEKPKAVTIFIRREGDGYTSSFLREAKKQIEHALQSGKLTAAAKGPNDTQLFALGEHLFAWFNC